jgi:hypothetical protein
LAARRKRSRRSETPGAGDARLGQSGPQSGSAPAGLDRAGTGRAAEATFGRFVAEASDRNAEVKTITQESEGLRYFFMDRTLGAAGRGHVSVLDFQNSHIPRSPRA